jgi:predicted acylesterase/phospholipase RssA
MLRAIAAERAKGRSLYIVTTNVDSQRAVIWDMTRIAASGSPGALKLFREVVAASASIPVVFPPVLIDAQAQGRHFQEMHVDGGVTAPILTLPEAFLLRSASLGPRPRLTIYVLINDKIDREFEVVPNGAINIAARASSLVEKTLLRSVLYETFASTRRDNIRLHLTYIDKDVPTSGLLEFKTSEMQALYRYGYDKAKTGTFWENAPPADDTVPHGPSLSQSRRASPGSW